MQELAFSNNPGEIGLSIFRLRIPPNTSEWSAELPIAQYAVSRGAIVFASPWNPPSHMSEFLRETSNGTDDMLLPEYYGEYVDHLNSYIDYMNDNGVPLYAVSVQNEPDWHGWTWWEPQQMLTFVRDYAQNINSRVIAPESLGYVRRMIDPLLNDSTANSHIDILGTHLYGTPKANFYYPLAYEKNKEIWMTEHLYGSASPEINNWSMALELAEEINMCMDAQMSSFNYWYIRRFYGLINDEGNITDKGYVFSQFSKFIRPGYKRVETNFEVAPKLTATAYKTDSSLVIVVVNENSTGVDINFNIDNITEGIATLTKFTTSHEKKMLNEGNFSINEGNFSATLDAHSISTFTSDPSQGGKFGNIPPLASAGDDMQLMNNGGNLIDIILEGSASSDPDGEIVKYSWAKDGYQISILPDLELELGLGYHTYILTVTDNDGATHSDTVNIDIYSTNTTEIWLEAECTEVGENWQMHTDNNASNGEFLMVKDGIEATGAPSDNPADHLVYNFHVPDSGNYTFWGRVLAPSWNDDSFWIKVNDSDWANWNGLANNNEWTWNFVFNQSMENQIIYPLDTGTHTLTLCYREDGAGIDKFYITNTGSTPENMGGDANNCVVEDTTQNASISLTNSNLKLFPNPAKSNLQISNRQAFNSLHIIDFNGRTVFSKSYNEAVLEDELFFNLKNGLYVLRISNDKSHTYKKFIVSK
jgi:glucuronoarabinoxylan endo-1,4-beta-xylanase